jgi:hypothetical protein
MTQEPAVTSKIVPCRKCGSIDFGIWTSASTQRNSIGIAAIADETELLHILIAKCGTADHTQNLNGFAS